MYNAKSFDIPTNRSFLPLKYQLIANIGKGQYGRVYRVKKEDRELALKIIKVETPEQVEIVDREIKNLQRLQCIPSLVCYYDSFQIGNKIFIEMEYIPGKNLYGFAKEYQKDINLIKYVKAIMIDLLKAIVYVHNSNLIHRDIKPENIMIKYPEFQPKLIDFGLACVSKQRKECMNNNCCLGKTGTPYFMAPETLLDGLSYPGSDIWSLGATVYTILTNLTVFTPKPETMVELKKLAASSPELISTGNYFMDNLLEQMLHKRVESRPTGITVIKYLNSEM